MRLISEPVSYSDGAASVVRRPSVCPSVRPWTLACARRFLRNCQAECSENWHITSTLGAVDAHGLIFQIGSYIALWWQIEIFC